MKPRFFSAVLMAWLVLAGLLPGCAAQTSADPGRSIPLQVVVTTTILGDVVRQVGGTQIALNVLIAPGVDEHGYEPSPQDLTKIASARLIFVNGAGLEPFLEKLTRNAGDPARVVAVSDGLTLQKSAEEAFHGAATAGTDPHVWMDPNNVLIWVDHIEAALSQADPAHAAQYQANANAYRQQLRDLDAWVRQQVQQIPQARRVLVTDHLVFTYFASRYGFVQAGALVPGYSTLAAPSAQELAALEDSMRTLGVPVVFVGNTVNPALAQRVTQDTHTRLVHILTGSLTTSSGPAPTYIDYIHFNVTAIVDALKE